MKQLDRAIWVIETLIFLIGVLSFYLVILAHESFAFTIERNEMYENWSNHSNSDYNCNVYIASDYSEIEGGIYYNICRGNYTITIINSSNISLGESLINANITIINSSNIYIKYENISKPLNIFNDKELFFSQGWVYNKKYDLYIETNTGAEIIRKKLPELICNKTSNDSGICYKKLNITKEWIYEEYPVFKTHNLTLKIQDKKTSYWDEWFESPNTIILVKENIEGEGTLRYLTEHALMHYYCYHLYKDTDTNHKRCFPKGSYR